MTEHYNEPKEWKSALKIIEIIFVIIYTIEALLKIYAMYIIDINKKGKNY